VEFLLRTMKPAPGSSILDVACGHGRHAIELAQRGFSVTGLDLSGELLAIARQAADEAGVSVRWIEADMRDTPTEQFDAAISMDTSFGYFAAQEDDEAVLSAMHDALRPGGRLFLAVLSREAFLSEDQQRLWRELSSNDLLLLHRTFDVFKSRLRIDALLIEADGSRHARTFDIRLYSLTELQQMLGRAGFEVRQVWGDYNGSPPAPARPRSLVLAERG
jgi:SAM-dependent methyltransferase